LARRAVFGVTTTEFSRPTCAENVTASNGRRVGVGARLSAPRHGNPLHAARNSRAQKPTPEALLAAPETGPANGRCSSNQLDMSKRGGDSMSDDKKTKSGPEEAVKGVVEGAKGLAKEAVGSVLGNKDLEHEGEAQQDKAQAQRDAAKKEAEAEAARGGAAAAEKRQQAHQK
jgi:uncharacterized protein YjbJ (UPF0337 family)